VRLAWLDQSPVVIVETIVVPDETSVVAYVCSAKIP
jgi:hypothetical protein